MDVDVVLAAVAIAAATIVPEATFVVVVADVLELLPVLFVLIVFVPLASAFGQELDNVTSILDAVDVDDGVVVAGDGVVVDVVDAVDAIPEPDSLLICWLCAIAFA